MLERVIESEFDAWPLHISLSPNKRTLFNFPMQSGGAEMLRLAANLLCDADLVPSMLVHDGILLELDNDEQVRHAIEIMERAGLAVCGGLKIGVDVDQRLEGGARYPDKRPMAQEDVGDGDGRCCRRSGQCRGWAVQNYKIRNGTFVPCTPEETAERERRKAADSMRAGSRERGARSDHLRQAHPRANGPDARGVDHLGRAFGAAARRLPEPWPQLRPANQTAPRDTRDEPAQPAQDSAGAGTPRPDHGDPKKAEATPRYRPQVRAAVS